MTFCNPASCGQLINSKKAWRCQELGLESQHNSLCNGQLVPCSSLCPNKSSSRRCTVAAKPTPELYRTETSSRHREGCSDLRTAQNPTETTYYMQSTSRCLFDTQTSKLYQLIRLKLPQLFAPSSATGHDVPQSHLLLMQEAHMGWMWHARRLGEFLLELPLVELHVHAGGTPYMSGFMHECPAMCVLGYSSSKIGVCQPGMMDQFGFGNCRTDPSML